jgi:hypothetical protein
VKSIDDALRLHTLGEEVCVGRLSVLVGMAHHGAQDGDVNLGWQHACCVDHLLYDVAGPRAAQEQHEALAGRKAEIFPDRG